MYECIVVGAGPAGLMAAIQASKRKKVLLIEKNDELGRKILVSGGGRCNITNRKPLTEFMRYVNDRFLYSTLSNFGPEEIIKFFEDNGLELKEEENNKMFPVSGKAKDVRDLLIGLLKDVDVVKEEVMTVEKDKYDFVVKTNKNEYKTRVCIVATGGITYPNLGATGDGYKFAKKFNHYIIKPFASNTPLVSDDSFVKEGILQGISLKDIELNYKKTKIRGAMIFTHFGISGPTVLDISKTIIKNLDKPVELTIDLLPDASGEELHKLVQIGGTTYLRELLPKRLADYLIRETGTAMNLSEISKKKMNKLIEMIKAFPVLITNYKGVDQAIITAGGVDLQDIDPKTMESKCTFNLYFVGEVLDIDGKTGGYNLTLALSTGYTAGISC